MKKLATVVGIALLCGAAFQEVDNEQYKWWSSFKAGSFVKFKSTSEAAGNKTESDMTYTLAEISAKEACVKMKTSMKIAGMEEPMESENEQKIPAKVKVEGKADPNAPKPKEGDEEIEVAGKKLKCHFIEMTTEQAGTKSWSKSWYCNDVPGRMVKMESKSEGTGFSATSNMVACEWKAN